MLKMAKKEEKQVVLERIYVIPLRKATYKVPRYKRSKKAIKVIREFVARHMKIPDHDISKVRIDKWLNIVIWHRGIKKPPSKIRVKVIKYSDNTAKVELVELPKKAQMAIKKEEIELKKAEEKKKEAERTEKLKEEERLLQKVRKTEHELIKPKKEVHRRMALEK